MKNLLYFVILFCCPLVFIACSDSKEEFDSMPYSFRLGGEIWNETDGLKADETALYGIEVLYADGSPYAYGLFDDLGKAKIKLLKEKQFTFRVVVVPNGQKLCHDIHSTATERYLDRFKEIYTLTSDDYCFLGNEFVYDTHVHFRYFRVPEKSYYYRIFTGYCSDFDRNAGNEIVIDMKAMFGEIVYRLNADIGDYVKELRVIGRLVSDTDPMDAEPIPSFDELKGQLGYSVVVISDKEFFYVRGVHVFSAFYITDYSKTKVPKRKPQNFNFFYSGESKSEFLLISHHARTEKDIRHLLAEPVGRR